MNRNCYALLFAVFFLLSGSAFGQNAIPQISNLTYVADTANHRVDLSFDLADNEGDPLEVWVQVSADSGRTWRVSIDSLSGDFGFPITPGTGKQLSWHYKPATLANFSPSGITGYSLRLVADDRQPIDILEVTNLVDSARVHQNLLAIEGVKNRATALPYLEETKDSLEAMMDRYDLHPYRHGDAYGNYVCENIIGRRSGTRNDTATWQISGHFDTVNNSPGGDDNASAVVCVQEAIRVLSNFQTKESLRFFEFDLEEDGLIGSYQYILNGVPDWEEPKGLLNMDGIGYYSDAVNSQVMPAGFNILFPTAYNSVAADSFRGNFITSVVNTNSAWIDTTFVGVAATVAPSLKIQTLEVAGNGLLTLDLRRSDHAPFWDGGYPAIFFTDGANFRNPGYHTPNDLVSAMDMDFYMKNVKAIIGTLARLAQVEHSTLEAVGPFDINVPVGNQQAKVVKAQPALKVYPNPNAGQMKLGFDLPEAGEISLELHDHHGKLIAVIAKGWREAGHHEMSWECNLPSDHYAMVLKAGEGRAFYPLVIQK